MEELLSEKNYICKPMSGLKNNCKLLIGFNPLTCKLFLGRGTFYFAQAPKPSHLPTSGQLFMVLIKFTNYLGHYSGAMLKFVII